MTFNLFGAVEYLANEKAQRYTKAWNDDRPRDALTYYGQLEGMRDLLALVGIEMQIDRDKDYNVTCTISKG